MGVIWEALEALTTVRERQFWALAFFFVSCEPYYFMV